MFSELIGELCDALRIQVYSVSFVRANSDHWLLFPRIFRQPQGHLLLIGVSGAGKTTLSRFVAWMNGLSVYQIKVNTLS